MALQNKCHLCGHRVGCDIKHETKKAIKCDSRIPLIAPWMLSIGAVVLAGSVAWGAQGQKIESLTEIQKTQAETQKSIEKSLRKQAETNGRIDGTIDAILRTLKTLEINSRPSPRNFMEPR